jgi:hypothetical protein
MQVGRERPVLQLRNEYYCAARRPAAALPLRYLLLVLVAYGEAASISN